jgi:hypothetical protein
MMVEEDTGMPTLLNISSAIQTISSNPPQGFRRRGLHLKYAETESEFHFLPDQGI